MLQRSRLSVISGLFTCSLFFVSSFSALAAPGAIGQSPLFISNPTPPNIFFMLDNSGSMNWMMPSDGVQSHELVRYWYYAITPETIPGSFDDDEIENIIKDWNAWCLGANLLAYDPNTNYEPWAANIPGTTLPLPDMSLTSAWVDPYDKGVVRSNNPMEIRGSSRGLVDLSGAPVVTWTDIDGDGEYDVGECPTSYSDPGVQLASSLSPSEQTNFANWFSYYRTREFTLKSAVTRVVQSSEARMGFSTINRYIGQAIHDMTDPYWKAELLKDLIKVTSNNSTPLRRALDRVGRYFAGHPHDDLKLDAGTQSPILSQAEGGECQQNFVMLMTDGQWNNNPVGVGSQDASGPFVFPAHADSTPETLGDIAMKWYSTDLAPSLAPKVPIQVGPTAYNLDENPDQHLVTFGVAFGPTGELTQGPTDRNQPFTWPIPAKNTNRTIDDLRHAAYNGRGQFLSAKNPKTLITAMQDVVANIESRLGSAASVSFNSTSLTTGASLFFASFNTAKWSGDLQSLSLNPETGDILPTPLWSAAAELDGKSNGQINNRAIYTLGNIAGGDRDGVLFKWKWGNPQILPSLRDDLKQNLDASIDQAPYSRAKNRLKFLKGIRDEEGIGDTRRRASRMGDVIHSSPLYIGPAISGWPDAPFFGTASEPYSAYQASLQASPREGIVYVGANDGLLHGVQASDGREVIAYLPSVVASATGAAGVHALTERNYVHKYYVDGHPVSSDVYIKTSPGGSKAWRTILIGSLRGGGRGLFALDATDPSLFAQTYDAAENTVLWEFTDQDDADLGYTFSVPEVTMMNNGQWAVVVGNGYNSGSGKAKLMVLFIEEGLDGHWSVNDYLKLDTGAGSLINKNGLSTPSLIDLDNNGTTDRIYAGDLNGNMWAFDVSASSASSWGVAHSGSALFSLGANHPITMKPLLHKPEPEWIEDNSSNTPNIMVYFGTGQYINHADINTQQQQAFYGIWDSGSVINAAQLTEQTFLSGYPSDARVLSHHNISYTTSGTRGWYIGLPENGERVIVNAFQFLDMVFFNTMTPSTLPCTAGGTSWLMAANMKTGGNPSVTAFDYNGDGVLTNEDNISDAYLAGKTFAHGIASATEVLSTDTGLSYGYTSGTNSTKPVKSPLPGGGVTGERGTWIQLFN